MPIYTKTGDEGTTSSFGGERLLKCTPQIEACGALDEATCAIGLAIESSLDEQDAELLTQMQQCLYLVMGFIAGAKLDVKKIAGCIKSTEKYIDLLDKKLPKLTKFILPQGSESAARLHIARTTVRHAERRVVGYFYNSGVNSPESSVCLKYLNRISDLLFMLARKYTKKERVL